MVSELSRNQQNERAGLEECLNQRKLCFAGEILPKSHTVLS